MKAPDAQTDIQKNDRKCIGRYRLHVPHVCQTNIPGLGTDA